MGHPFVYGLLSVKKDAVPLNDLIFLSVLVLSFSHWYLPLHFALSSMPPLERAANCTQRFQDTIFKLLPVASGSFYEKRAILWMALAITSEEPSGRTTTATAMLIPFIEKVPPTWWWLPRSSHLWQMVTFTPAGNVAGQPNVKEGLQGRLRCLTLGQLLATSWAFKCSPVHSHRHHKTLDVLLLHRLRQADVPQAWPQLV